MKKKIIYFVILISVIFLQLSLVPAFFDLSKGPDLVLMLVLAWTIRDGFEKFISWMILAGVLNDLLDYSSVGTHVIIFVFSSYMVSFLSRFFVVQIRGIGFLFLAVFVFLSMFFARSLIFLLPVLNENGNSFAQIWQNFNIWQGFGYGFAFNMIFVMISLWFIKHIKKYFFI